MAALLAGPKGLVLVVLKAVMTAPTMVEVMAQRRVAYWVEWMVSLMVETKETEMDLQMVDKMVDLCAKYPIKQNPPKLKIK